ncbi:L-aspartate oxidase [Helicobacter brantae]|uniref:L-aspartate oxidase n=1 Tax=Helicobacter brantae TaxID=375927 RepID=A0A3D8J157_9HELI|nr:FAD-dependent oxidoreductase [Helicobacter brantae]RDU70960.1 L-aspartate oxidase [Helicobacter brantae]
MKYDIIIVGAGVAGLYCAMHLPKSLKVLLVCKDEPWECNTFYAQGGISVAKDREDIAEHIADTLNAGVGFNTTASVETLCQESVNLIKELEEIGLRVDRDERGEVLYAKEGGHKKARIIHFDGDGTGRFLHTHLITQLKHPLCKQAQVIDLLIENGRCYGVSLLNRGEITQVYAKCVVLASGGVGGLYRYHTNAYTISSDLHGMILEHHCKLKDMEMLQFHPTVYTSAPTARKPLISEAVRGEGGKIVDREGRRFLFDYDERGELAPRDIVSRGIFDYCKRHNQEAFLDLSSFSKEGFEARFPNIYHSLTSYKLQIPEQKIPISPAFHYSMGGIAVDERSKVLGIENLYAIGECANNGIHGANRLASNSLLEGLIFGKRVARDILGSSYDFDSKQIFPILKESLQEEGDITLKNTLRKIMWDKVGIIRTPQSLNSALGGVEAMLECKIGRMLRLRLLVAKEIIHQALRRKESLGAHFITDDA